MACTTINSHLVVGATNAALPTQATRRVVFGCLILYTRGIEADKVAVAAAVADCMAVAYACDYLLLPGFHFQALVYIRGQGQKFLGVRECLAHIAPASPETGKNSLFLSLSLEAVRQAQQGRQDVCCLCSQLHVHVRERTRI